MRPSSEPSLVSDDPVNGVCANAISAGKRASSSFGSANFSNLVPCELSQGASWAFAAFSFRNHIGHIFGMSSKPQMRRVYARSVVSSGAVVKNPQTGWNRTIVKYPRGHMASYSNSSSLSDTPISCGIFSANPKPAGFSLLNFGQESPLERLGESLRNQILRGNLWVHNQFVWLCRALGCFSTAEVFLFSPSTLEVQA